MKFHLSERSISEKTGYSRGQLLNLRSGYKQIKKGKLYKSAPLLVKGRDWQKMDNGSVLYADSAVRILIDRRSEISTEELVE
jgi:hypothetical protein